MLISAVQQSDSVIHIHIFILFQILFPYRLLHNIEQSSLCYTVGPFWLSVFLSISKIFIYLLFWLRQVFIAVRWLSLAVANRGYSFIAVHRLLIMVASLVAEHRL